MECESSFGYVLRMLCVTSYSRKATLQTTKSYLVLASLRQKLDETPYGTPRSGSSSMRTFLPGPGEALPLQALVIHFEGVIRIEGNLLRWVCLLSSPLICLRLTSISPRKNCILFSKRNPPSIQRIPWPMADDTEPHNGNEEKEYEYDSWVLTEQSFQWLIDMNGRYSQMLRWPTFRILIGIQLRFRIFHRSAIRTSNLGSRQTAACMSYS